MFAAFRSRVALAFVVYLARLAVAAAAALPAALFAGALVGDFPRGDRELMDPGGAMLADLLWNVRRAVVPVSAGAAATLALATVFGVFVFGAFVAGLGKVDWSARDLADGAARRWGTVAVFGLLGLVVQALLAGIVVSAGVALLGALYVVPPAKDIATAAFALVAAVVWLAVGLVRDLVSVAAVRRDVSFGSAFAWGWRAFGRSRGALVWGYVWTGAIALGVVAGALFVPSEVSTVVHQIVAFVLVLTRAAFLARAVAAVDRIVAPAY